VLLIKSVVVQWPLAAGLVNTEVLMRLGVVLVCLSRGYGLLWVLDEITAPVEKHFGPSAMNSISERAADPLREDILALSLVLYDVEKGEVLGAELACEKVGEVADLSRDLAERAGDKARHGPRVARVRLCLDGSSCVCGDSRRASWRPCGSPRAPRPRSSRRMPRMSWMATPSRPAPVPASLHPRGSWPRWYGY